jgi:predicted transcriptional regulator
MTVTLNLPDDLASQLAEILPEAERDRFLRAAIENALDMLREDAEDCASVVERALEDLDAGRNVIPFDEACRRWDSGAPDAPGAASR